MLVIGAMKESFMNGKFPLKTEKMLLVHTQVHRASMFVFSVELILALLLGGRKIDINPRTGYTHVVKYLANIVPLFLISFLEALFCAGYGRSASLVEAFITPFLLDISLARWPHNILFIFETLLGI